MPNISILVPVYNVEDYVGACLDSLVKQTYQDMEIIVINDGSTDRSLDVVEAYQKLYPQIKVYSYRNAGVSVTRNRALDAAKGKYLMFVDSDDTLALNAIEVMMDYMNKNDCDIVCCGYTFDLKHIKIRRRICKEGTMTSLEALHSLAKGTGVNNYPWGKIFKRECFSGIRFPANQCHFEDAYTIFKTMIRAKRIGNVSQRFYHYNYRRGSLTNQMDLATIYRMRDSITYQESVLHRIFPEENFQFMIQYYNSDMMILYTLLRHYTRKDHVVYEAADIDWKQIPFIFRIGYVLLRNFVSWKVGCIIRPQEDWEA